MLNRILVGFTTSGKEWKRVEKSWKEWDESIYPPEEQGLTIGQGRGAMVAYLAKVNEESSI